jgi:TPR repeat protein
VWAPELASILSPKSTDLEQGLFAFETGEYDVAFHKLNPLSEAGVAMAQNVVGRMYLRGQGVPRDYNQALLLFRKAASQGLANAQNNLGVMYAAGQGVQQNYKQAIVWFREAADQGYALAMDSLGDMYMMGLGVTPDKAEAYRWWAKARSAGFSGKMDIVGIKTVGANEYKKGLESYYRWEFTEAARLFVEAAKKGHPEAQLILGTMYKHGQGVLKDETQGRYWIQRANDQGHALDDNRNRVLIFDASAENFNKTEKTPHIDALAPKGCACSKGTRPGNCKCAMR